MLDESPLLEPVATATDPASFVPPPQAVHVSHLDWLENEAIHILREVAGQCANPALLFSGGKDSLVLLRLARKRSGPVRFRSRCCTSTRATIFPR